MNQFKKTVLMCAGFLLVALGIIGIFMPVMPSTPFFIIASVCFSKSSKKFHDLLLNNKWIGPHIRRYHEKNGIRLEMKIFFIVIQWAGILFTSTFIVRNIFGKALMAVIGLGATIYILSLKTVKK